MPIIVAQQDTVDPSKLAAGVMLQARRLCRLRREAAFSPESTAGFSEANFNGGPSFRGRGADRRWCFGASCGFKVREETGRLSSPQRVTAFRLSSMVIEVNQSTKSSKSVPDYIWGSRISRFA